MFRPHHSRSSEHPGGGQGTDTEESPKFVSLKTDLWSEPTKATFSQKPSVTSSALFGTVFALCLAPVTGVAVYPSQTMSCEPLS